MTEKSISLWSDTCALPEYAPLDRDMNTDVLVIGGGMAGILCASALTRAGIDCVLIEADRLCGTTTKDTTAKITSQHGLIYHTLLKRFGAEKTRLYLMANEDALEEYRSLCRDKKSRKAPPALSARGSRGISTPGRVSPAEIYIVAPSRAAHF